VRHSAPRQNSACPAAAFSANLRTKSFLYVILPARRSTLFPYTTLFRSHARGGRAEPGREHRSARFAPARAASLRVLWLPAVLVGLRNVGNGHVSCGVGAGAVLDRARRARGLVERRARR